MKQPTRILMPGVVAALLLAATFTVSAQDARFFRIAGPVPTAITEFRSDGTVVWTNATTNTTFTVQMACSLADGTNWSDYIQVPATTGLNTNRIWDFNPPSGMALIPTGSFLMGATTNMGHESYSGETPQHTVYVSAFYMDKYEVTKALWDDVYNWAVAHGYGFTAGRGKAANHPVQTITWYDMAKWCNARSEKAGLTPCYYTDATRTIIYRSGSLNLTNDCVNWAANGYRLPTEAEWEKAARGGASGQRFPWSDSDTIQHSRANYYSSTSYAYDTSSTRGNHPTFNDGFYPYTSPAGYFAPNGYGLYDMAGNVREWCWDWYSSSYYSSSPSSDPRGPATALNNRVLRGGSFDFNAGFARCAYRGSFTPGDFSGSGFGFRCVRGF